MRVLYALLTAALAVGGPHAASAAVLGYYGGNLTSTTLPSFASLREPYAWRWHTDTAIYSFPTTDNEMRCLQFVASETITGATTVRWESAPSDTVTGGTFGAGFYDADGDPLYGAGEVAFSSYNTSYTLTLSASVTLTAGTEYRFCWCAETDTAVQGKYYGTPQTGVNDLLNMWTAKRIGKAANSCTGSAVLPQTTGALTAENTYGPIWVLVGVP